ncbi:MAG: hypothetical protein U0800_23405 [Isosphaeraceae bacterium]
MTLDPPSQADHPPPSIPRTTWTLEYWRSCAICRPIGADNWLFNLGGDHNGLIADLRELLESGCADRIVLDLSSLGPFSTWMAGAVVLIARKADELGLLIALVAQDGPTQDELRSPRLRGLAPVLPSVSEATALLRNRPIPDRVPPPL